MPETTTTISRADTAKRFARLNCRVMWRAELDTHLAPVPVEVVDAFGPPKLTQIDADGREVYPRHTHFDTEEEAWDGLERQAEARIAQLKDEWRRIEEEQHQLALQMEYADRELTDVREMRGRTPAE